MEPNGLRSGGGKGLAKDKPPSNAELAIEVARLKSEVRHQRTLRGLGTTAKVFRDLNVTIRSVTPWLLSAYVTVKEGDSVRVAIVELAKQNLTLSSLCGLFAILAISGVTYGARQKKLRREYMDRNEDFRRRYEELLDRDRTSSRIMRNGETREGDD